MFYYIYKILIFSIIILGIFLLFSSPMKISAAVPCPTEDKTTSDSETADFYLRDCSMNCVEREDVPYLGVPLKYYDCTTGSYQGGAITTIATKVDLGTELNKIYKWGIGLVGVLAFIMITYGGVLYMVSGAVDQKNKAKGVIQNALIGLLLALASYMILEIINPQLVSLESWELKKVEPTKKGEPEEEKKTIDECLYESEVTQYTNMGYSCENSKDTTPCMYPDYEKRYSCKLP